MSKLRVHELARELGRQNREVIEFLKSKGVAVRSHMSMVDEPAVSEVKTIITGERSILRNWRLPRQKKRL